MFLDSRSSLILEELASYQGRVSIKLIMEKHSLNARQIDYSLTKLNDYLVYNGFSKVLKSNGELIADFDCSQVLRLIRKESKSIYVPSESERLMISFLMIIGKRQSLSLQDFIIDLDISKNTALKNIRNLKQYLVKEKLKLDYSRNDGYVVKGKESKIRLLIRDTVTKLLEDEWKKAYLLALLDIEEEVQVSTRKIIQIEHKLGFVYSDDRHYVSALLIAIFLRRINEGCCIKKLNKEMQEITTTQEYEEICQWFDEGHKIPKEELVYLTLNVLSIDISSVEDDISSEIPGFRRALDEMIDLFEKQACIVFLDRTFLLRMLIQHLKPAYYRVKYSLSLPKRVDEALLHEAANKEFKEIYQIVRGCIAPVEEVFGSSLPKNEQYLLTLIFASEMKKKQEEKRRRYRAAVVCSEGISVSRILYLTLSELLPELTFLTPMSVRELKQVDEAEYDLIISPFYVETNKKLITIDPVITQNNRNMIREKILNQIYGINSNHLSVERIMDIIKQHSDVFNERQLLSNLTQYIYEEPERKSAQVALTKENPTLAELVTENYIVKIKRVTDWAEAINCAAVPMIESGGILPDYPAKIIANYHEMIPHIVFGKEIAVPHANFESAVNQLGMCLLVVEEGVRFTEHQYVHLILLLATPDKNSHLSAMLQLLDLSANDLDVQQIITAETKEEIHSILRKYQ